MGLPTSLDKQVAYQTLTLQRMLDSLARLISRHHDDTTGGIDENQRSTSFPVLPLPHFSRYNESSPITQ